jgi:hypothetical protein
LLPYANVQKLHNRLVQSQAGPLAKNEACHLAN